MSHRAEENDIFAVLRRSQPLLAAWSAWLCLPSTWSNWTQWAAYGRCPSSDIIFRHDTLWNARVWREFLWEELKRKNKSQHFFFFLFLQNFFIFFCKHSWASPAFLPQTLKRIWLLSSLLLPVLSFIINSSLFAVLFAFLCCSVQSCLFFFCSGCLFRKGSWVGNDRAFCCLFTRSDFLDLLKRWRENGLNRERDSNRFSTCSGWKCLPPRPSRPPL